jgi:hypothetical protein
MTPNFLKAQSLRVHPFIQYSMGMISNHCWFSKCAYSKRKKIVDCFSKEGVLSRSRIALLLE